MILHKFFSIYILINNYVSTQPSEYQPSIDLEHYEPSRDECYDETGKAQRCVPDFINAAFNRYVEVTNTCGINRPTKFCVQSKVIGSMAKTCEVCDSRASHTNHPSTYLTDFNAPDKETWWQSETMNEGLQHPTSVNLTLKLGKTYDVTYVRLKFVSPRPESFAIYKKINPEDEWVPWQYYSSSCRSTYKTPEKLPILPGNELVAQCTREYSDISPLTGGNIAFSTLEGRPSAHNYEISPQLHELVTASEIMIVLNRMNTFGDELFQDQRVLQSYYYAISDFAVGARCKCNGHAAACVKSTGHGEDNLVCACEHFTTGVDCNECAPFYNDKEWRAGTTTDANECQACDCNNLSHRCYYDAELFNKTGRGGYCIDCAGNTRGPHCEECVTNHWRRPQEHFCVSCGCNEVGSVNGQCDAQGDCTCKPGVTGKRCDQCIAGFFEFGPNGCQDCGCEENGSVGNLPSCDVYTGQCSCKKNVEGKHCNTCKPGHFNLSPNNELGCTPCFCYGHSSICQSTDGYFAHNVTSSFAKGKDEWTTITDDNINQPNYDEIEKAIAITSGYSHNQTYFNAPSEFLGDQRPSYNQMLTFTLKLQKNYAHVSQKDIIITSGTGRELSLPITAQGNPIPSSFSHVYSFRLHPNYEYQWSPRLNEFDFISFLSNITSIRIRGTFGPNDVAYFSNCSLGSATMSLSESNAVPVGYIETCSCPEGYIGQFCESCDDGYKRETKFGGAFNRCVKCECNSHSDSCDSESGSCLCQDNTEGNNCERCLRGYYGNSLLGKDDDCSKCDCPDDGPCIFHTDGDILCTDCKPGYTGRRCDECSDGYYGNPSDGIPCQQCNCNGNVDSNAIGICNTITGECTRCYFNTNGFNCENCIAGHWGQPLAEEKGDCKACQCYPQGTVKPTADYEVLECSQDEGQCNCLENVVGSQCNTCKDGYFNIVSGKGCESCECDTTGSVNSTCDIVSGQCFCKAGVTGPRCDQCAPLHFGFSDSGCKKCECNEFGSDSMQCDVESGQCLCYNNVEGRQCDVCSENKYDLEGGCLACDECYDVIQHRTNNYRQQFSNLNTTLYEIIENPVEINDIKFDAKVKEALAQVRKVHDEVKNNLGNDNVIVGEIKRLRNNLKDADDMLREVDNMVNKVREASSDGKELLEDYSIQRRSAASEINAARDLLEKEGVYYWDLASAAAEKYGDQSQALSDIALEARLLTSIQEETAKEIVNLSKEASQNADHALKETKEVIYGNDQVTLELRMLEQDLNKAKLLLEETSAFALKQQQEAMKANREAGEMLNTAIELKIPDITLKKYMDEKDNNIKLVLDVDEALRAQSLKNTPVVDEMLELKRNAETEFEQAKQMQLRYDNLLDQISDSKERALMALNESDSVFNEAQGTLKVFKDFQNTIDGSKDKAMESLGKIKEIKERIFEVDQKSDVVKNLLGDSLADAEAAQAFAIKAESETREILSKVAKLRSGTLQTKAKSASVLEEVKRIEAAIEKSKLDLEEFKRSAKLDNSKGEEAVDVASKADNMASYSNKTLIDATDRIKNVLDSLDSLDNVDNKELDLLEAKLEAAENAIKNSKFEDKLQSLRELKKQQDQTLSYLTSELEALKADGENLAEIQMSLPRKCFNEVSIEQEGQK
uniref:Laminin EGF-like domain-containing protein n=1 Tax=Rhabditophanes sp. KR3021 TaxID=114890 RepID=A0AC35TKI7_9BILA